MNIFNIKRLILFSSLIVFSTSFIYAQKIDFSGTWIRNSDKTDAGDLSMNSVPASLEIKQDNNSISIKRNSKNAQGEIFNYSEVLNFNGTAANSSPKANINKKATIKWSDDHKTLIVSADYSDSTTGRAIQKTNDTWSLSEDGKTMTITIVLNVNEQIHNLKEVFDKQ
ncbi:MAG: hypothetical protein WDM78_07685 [Puia sp.]